MRTANFAMRITYISVILGCIYAVSAFNCPEDGSPLYHADVESGCQIYHYCDGSVMHTLTCPSGQSFNYDTLSCADAATVHCHETHHVHKRHIEEVHSIRKAALLEAVQEVYRKTTPIVKDAVAKIAPSILEKFETSYLPTLISLRDDLYPIFKDQFYHRLVKVANYAQRMSKRVFDKLYTTFELSNSTHINLVSFSDVADDIANDLQPVFRLGKYVTARLMQQTQKTAGKAKRSLEGDEVDDQEEELREENGASVAEIGQTLVYRTKRFVDDLVVGMVDPSLQGIVGQLASVILGNDNSLTSKVILPIIYEMYNDPETRFDIERIIWSAKSALAPLISEMLSKQTAHTPAGTVITIPQRSVDLAKAKFEQQTKPIIRKVFQKHLPMIFRRAANHVPLILSTLDRMKPILKANSGVLKDSILSFITKHGAIKKTSTSTQHRSYTYTEIKDDLRPIKVTVIQMLLEYLNSTPDSVFSKLFNKDSFLFRSLIGEPRYAVPANERPVPVQAERLPMPIRKSVTQRRYYSG